MDTKKLIANSNAIHIRRKSHEGVRSVLHRVVSHGRRRVAKWLGRSVT